VNVVLGSHRVFIQCRHNPYSYPLFTWSHRPSTSLSCLTVLQVDRVFDEPVLEHEGRLSVQMPSVTQFNQPLCLNPNLLL